MTNVFRRIAFEECEIYHVLAYYDKRMQSDDGMHAFDALKVVIDDYVFQNIRFMKGVGEYGEDDARIGRTAVPVGLAMVGDALSEIKQGFDEFFNSTLDGVALYRSIKKSLRDMVKSLELEFTMSSLAISYQASDQTENESNELRTILSLRQYQQALVKKAWYNIKKPSMNPTMIYLPTGGGKTVVACELIKRIVNEKNCRVGFFVHTDVLFDQAFHRIREWPGVGKNSVAAVKGGIKRMSGDQIKVYVCTIQSFKESGESIARSSTSDKLAREMDLDFILIDECHRSYAESYSSMMKRFPKAKVVGFTATPFRADEDENLREVFSGNRIDGPSISYLIKLNYLVSPLVYRSCLADPRSCELGLSTPKDMLVSDMHLEKVVRRWYRMWKCFKSQVPSGGSVHHPGITMNTTIVFCQTVEHSKQVVSAFHRVCNDEVIVERLDGKISQKQRESMLASLKSMHSHVLVCVNTVSEGFDLPQIDCILMLRKCTSKVLYVQQIGRGLRRSEGKKVCLVLDEANNAIAHGHVEYHFSDERVIPNSCTPKPRTSKPCPIKGCPSIIARRPLASRSSFGNQIQKLGQHLHSAPHSQAVNAKLGSRPESVCVGCSLTRQDTEKPV